VQCRAVKAWFGAWKTHSLWRSAAAPFAGRACARRKDSRVTAIDLITRTPPKCDQQKAFTGVAHGNARQRRGIS